MSDSLINNPFIDGIKNYFPDISFEYKKTEINSGSLHSFIVGPISEEKLNKSWDKISNYIAVHFQSNLTDEFDIWNLYVFFIVDNGGISNALKYKIENNTFSARKIVIENTNGFASIIDDYILNNKLINNYQKKGIEVEHFERNNLIVKSLAGKVVRKAHKTSEAYDAFEKLVNLIKDQADEI